MSSALIDRLHHEAESYGLHEDVRALLREAADSLAAPSVGADAVAWGFQHDETGRMTVSMNDGINTPEVFLRLNPGHSLIGPIYTAPQPDAREADVVLIRQAVARGWCAPENSAKVMDVDLAHAIVREVVAALAGHRP